MESLDYAARHARGISAIARLLAYWWSRSDLSYDKFSAVMDWAYRERSPLDKTSMSRLRNEKAVMGAGLRHLDAMAEGNRAIWYWHRKGPEIAIQTYGPFSSWGVEQEWLDKAVWLPKADDDSQPLELGDFAALLLGRLELPYVNAAMVSPGQAVQINDQLPDFLDRLAAERKWGPREAVNAFLAAYPGTDRARQHRLKGLILGEQRLSAAELEGELAALAEMVRRIRDLKAYGPAELRSELSSGNRSDL